MYLDSISIDHPENACNGDPFHRVDIANFEAFPLGNAIREQDPAIMDIPHLEEGQGKEGS